ncbi:MAG: antibiotic biosynthesis monooxygenase [Nannocystaceae bacterium]
MNASHPSSESSSEAVTVVMTRRVKPGREPDYEAWLHRLIEAAKEFPGYLGTTVQPPASSGPREYTSVVRFDSVRNLRRFEGLSLAPWPSEHHGIRG